MRSSLLCIGRAAALALATTLGPGPGTGTAADIADTPRVASRPELAAAMAASQGYDLTATANGPRLQAEVVLRLLREAVAGDPEHRPLFIGHREWFEAFLDRTGLAPSAAPLYVRLPFEVGQDLVADHHPGRVVADVLQGPKPRLAANVRIFWPEAPGKPREYSYDDRLSNPNLRVTQKRVITYRLVDYGDRLWYAEVAGLHGRPTTGALGLLFDLIGEARVVESRSAFASDGSQVVRGRATKFGIDRTETVVVWPSGQADRGVPKDRPDLQGLDARLREPLAIRFRPVAP